METWQPAYVALGSNQGDPSAQVREAATRLGSLPATRFIALSPLFGSKPFGPVAQPDFVNAVAGLLTRLSAEQMLEQLKSLERALGRPAEHARWGPRPIDLDLLALGREQIESAGLTLPHPGIVERNFVLYPLAHIAPELDLPGLGRVAALRERVTADGIWRLEGSIRYMTTHANGESHRYIVVEGPIGVGKTSLARRLGASLAADLVLEQAGDNPFLERFYRNPRAGAFPTQLYFLFQRAQQLATLKQQDLFAPVRVADYLLEKDRLFARVTLDEAEYALYAQVSDKLDIEAPKPDLVIYLQAPVDVLLERIGKRGIGYEQQIEREYLERLNEAYARFFHEYEGAPLLIVNAASIDPVNNQSDFDELMTAVTRMKRGRLYYNPLRHASI